MVKKIARILYFSEMEVEKYVFRSTAIDGNDQVV